MRSSAAGHHRRHRVGVPARWSAWRCLGRRRPGSASTSARVLVSSRLMPSVSALAARRLRRCGGDGGGHQRVTAVADFDVQRCRTNCVVQQLPAHRLQPRGEDRGQHGHALRDALQADRAVVNRVEARDDGGQHLRGADVRRGLLAADVLLAGLQREAVGGRAVAVHADADQPAGQRALEGVLRGQIRGVRAAGTHRHAEALGRAERDVGAEFTRRDQQRQRQQVRADDGHRAGGVRGVDDRFQVTELAVDAGVLQQHAERWRGGQRGGDLGGVNLINRDAQRLGAGADDFERLRQHVVRDDEARGLRLAHAGGQRHRFGGGGGLVEHRGVGDRHAGQVGHHRLEVDQRLHAALADLGLIRRVGGVPGRVFEHVAQDDAGCQRAEVAAAEVAGQHAVLRRERLQLGQCLRLAQRGGQFHRRGAGDRARDDRVDQRTAAGRADGRQHARLVGRARADVAGGEFAGVFQIGEAGQGGVWHGGGASGQRLFWRFRQRRGRDRAGSAVGRRGRRGWISPG